MNADDRRERRVAWVLLLICPLSLVALCTYITLLEDSSHIFDLHPRIYLQTTCLLWASIMTLLPVARLRRILALPIWFMLILYGDMYIFVTSLLNGLYMELSWWANFTHVVSSLVVSSIVYMALCVMAAHSPSHVVLSKGAIVMMTFLIGCAFGVIWEVGEGLVEIITKVDYMSYGAVHTLYNLVADVVGAAIMAVIAFCMLRKHDAVYFASKVRIGRAKIEY